MSISGPPAHGPWPNYTVATDPTTYQPGPKTDTQWLSGPPPPIVQRTSTLPIIDTTWPSTPPPVVQRSATLVSTHGYDPSSMSISEKGLPTTPGQVVFQQPQPQQSMISNRRNGGNRNVKNLPLGPDGRSWSYGLCDCCGDWAICCLTWGHPSCAFGTIKKRYGYLEHGGTPDPEHGNRGFCGGQCCLHYSLTIIAFQWIPQMMLRSKIRARYNIAGNCCSDCCTSFWCGPCDLSQQSREVLLEEDSFIVR